jgi:hypothetical protein
VLDDFGQVIPRSGYLSLLSFLDAARIAPSSSGA